MTSIDLSNITKTFGSITAVDIVTLSINDGESLSILGPSGSGKSTVLRIIPGLEGPGTVALDGQDQSGIPAHQRDVSIVFQNFALHPHLNSLDNITLGLRHGLGLSKDHLPGPVPKPPDSGGRPHALHTLPVQGPDEKERSSWLNGRTTFTLGLRVDLSGRGRNRMVPGTRTIFPAAAPVVPYTPARWRCLGRTIDSK